MKDADERLAEIDLEEGIHEPCSCSCHEGKIAPHDEYCCPACGEWNPYDSPRALGLNRD